MWTPSFFKRAQLFTKKPTIPTLRINHCLKTYPAPFCAMWDGIKKFEVRWDDRGFEIGHWLKLDEYDQSVKRYTQRFLVMRVLYILRGPAYGLPDGMAVMSLALCATSETVADGSVELELIPGAYGP